MYQTLLDTPIGTLLIEGTREAIIGVHFVVPGTSVGKSCRLVNKAKTQLRQYFKGKRKIFDLPLDLSACRDFQKRVLAEVSAVDYGRTTTYAEIARRLKRVAAQRAVGRANARNPISIIIPCHRVIASNGKLTGYGGGLKAKEWLLTHEKALLV